VAVRFDNSCEQCARINSELFPPGWGNIYRKDRKSGHGGVLAAVKRSLDNSHVDMHTEPESISLEITAKSDPPLIMAALYRPPATGKKW